MDSAPPTDARSYRRRDVIGPLLAALHDLDGQKDVERFDRFVRNYGVCLTSFHDASVVDQVRQILLRNASEGRALCVQDGEIWLKLCKAGD